METLLFLGICEVGMFILTFKPVSPILHLMEAISPWLNINKTGFVS